MLKHCRRNSISSLYLVIYKLPLSFSSLIAEEFLEMEPHGGGGTRTPPKNPIQQDSKSIGVNAASGRLVYVRRRVEVDTSKAAASTNPNPPKVPPQPQAQEPTTTSHKLDWEERYLHLQMLLNKLNQSDRTDHVQSKLLPISPTTLNMYIHSNSGP